VLVIAIVAVAHSFWIIIGKNPSGDACNGKALHLASDTLTISV
jgi:hypothetical protein